MFVSVNFLFNMDVDEQYDKSQLPDTQKYDSDYNSGDIAEVVEENSNHIWGRLYPIGFNLQPRDLIKPAYRIGRGPECEIQLTSQHVEPIILAVISKVQFRLELEVDHTGSHVFSLVDLSSNGTFVNKKKVGKNGKVYLSNNDEISLSQPHNKAYLFIDALICNSWLPLSERRNYSIITQLGQGAFGEVKLAIEKRTGKRYAIKRILKTIYQSDVVKVQIANEIKILKQINHQCTIKMEDVFENEEAVFIVLEYMPGGDLQQRIRQRKVLNESDAKFLFYQLMLAVQYLHQEGITHRDLKPENILLASDTSEPLLKLSDFGLSKLMQSASTLKTFCGTLSYTAPEILLSKGCSSYTPQVDVWSLGCVLYLCLSGFPAFSSKGSMPIQEQIVRGYYQSLKNSPELKISDSANDLIDRMLVVNPLHRITVADTLKHSWLQDGQTRSKVENLIANAGKENLENLSPEFENLKKKRITEFAVTKRLD